MYYDDVEIMSKEKAQSHIDLFDDNEVDGKINFVEFANVMDRIEGHLHDA